MIGNQLRTLLAPLGVPYCRSGGVSGVPFLDPPHMMSRDVTVVSRTVVHLIIVEVPDGGGRRGGGLGRLYEIRR